LLPTENTAIPAKEDYARALMIFLVCISLPFVENEDKIFLKTGFRV